MLCIWSAMTGKQLASIPAEEVDDVRALKQLLHSKHRLPPPFRQRLVYLDSVSDGVLDDLVKLDSPMDLQLILIPYVQASQLEANELAAAAAKGSLPQVEAKLQKPQDPNVDNTSGSSPLGLATACAHLCHGWVTLLHFFDGYLETIIRSKHVHFQSYPNHELGIWVLCICSWKPLRTRIKPTRIPTPP
ncbi:ANKRD50 [Symbiodinium sp. CCMP2592]|nr:ANKRD50 [Symbiodinium sp. CCMP2592]